jgi:hypothetical protein
VHFVGIGRLWPDLGRDGSNGISVQRAQVVATVHVVPAPVEYRLGTSFFQWRIVQKGIRPGVEYFLGQRRSFDYVAGKEVLLIPLNRSQ